MPLPFVTVPPIDVRPTVADVLHRAAREHGARAAVVTPTTRTTYRELELGSGRLAKQLVAAGVVKGARVGLLFPQDRDWIVTFLAAARIGAVVVPVSTFSTPAEIRRVVRHADVAHLVVPRRLFGADLADRLEAAVPSLAGARSSALFVPAVPMLRSIAVLGETDRPWMHPLGAMSDGEMRAMGIDDDLLAAIESEVTPADWLVILSTSGTTTAPKGVVLTNGSLVRHAANLAGLRHLGEQDTIFAAMPFFWVGGLILALLPALYAGAGLVCQDRFDAEEALDLIERERPSKLVAWPNVRRRLVDDPTYASREIHDVAFLAPAGSPQLDPRSIHNSLGMTETCGPHTFASAEEMATRLPEPLRGSFGPRVPDVQHRIVDPDTGDTLADDQEGEICVRGYSLMVGLYKQERDEVFDQDGWYHTGDRGYFREGYLFFTGRGTEMIKTAGFNVAPREVEVALESLPEVRLAVVFGRADEERGEAVVAGVVASPARPIDADSLKTQLRELLSPYKVPRAIVCLDESDVPLLSSGKPDRAAVQALIAQHLDG